MEVVLAAQLGTTPPGRGKCRGEIWDYKGLPADYPKDVNPREFMVPCGCTKFVPVFRNMCGGF